MFKYSQKIILRMHDNKTGQEESTDKMRPRTSSIFPSVSAGRETGV